jgi:putative transcriptional regulator
VIPAIAILVGKLLIATEKSHDPDLAKSVVLIIHVDKDAVMGLILNRPVKDLYFGGPIAIGAKCLSRSTGEKIVAGVYLSPKPVKDGRIYAGYVGWSRAQIEDEVKHGLWKVRDGTAQIVFDPNPATLWDRLLR